MAVPIAKGIIYPGVFLLNILIIVGKHPAARTVPIMKNIAIKGGFVKAISKPITLTIIIDKREIYSKCFFFKSLELEAIYVL